MGSPAIGKTLILTAENWDRVGGMDEQTPSQSLALYRSSESARSTGTVQARMGAAMLFRYKLDEIPEDHRVVHAELILPVQYKSGNEPRFYVWRMLASWGAGVCYDYRQTWPEKLKWTKPGAAGLSSDRAPRPTDIVRLPDVGAKTINVTEDVELWASGEASNEGWMITVEDPGIAINFASPLWVSANDWRLRVTYEPK